MPRGIERIRAVRVMRAQVAAAVAAPSLEPRQVQLRRLERDVAELTVLLEQAVA